MAALSAIRDGGKVDDKSDRLNGLPWFINAPPSSVLSPSENVKSSGGVVVMVTGALDPHGLNTQKDKSCTMCYVI